MYNNFSPPSGTRVFLDSGRRTWSSRSPCLQLMINFLCWCVIWLIIVTIVTIVTFRVLRFVGLGWCSQSTPSPTFFAPGFHSHRYPCDQAWSSLIRCRRWGNRSWSSSATRPPTSSSSSSWSSSRKGSRTSWGMIKMPLFWQRKNYETNLHHISSRWDLPSDTTKRGSLPSAVEYAILVRYNIHAKYLLSW